MKNRKEKMKTSNNCDCATSFFLSLKMLNSKQHTHTKKQCKQTLQNMQIFKSNSPVFVTHEFQHNVEAKWNYSKKSIHRVVAPSYPTIQQLLMSMYNIFQIRCWIVQRHIPIPLLLISIKFSAFELKSYFLIKKILCDFVFDFSLSLYGTNVFLSWIHDRTNEFNWQRKNSFKKEEKG